MNCHCGFPAGHLGACPRVKALEYYPDGTIRRVEYHDAPAPVLAGPLPSGWRVARPAPLGALREGAD